MVEEELCKGPEQLKTEVIGAGWCVSCGACVELCPYIKAVGDRVAVTHSCGLSDGNCYRVCPRTHTDYGLLAELVTGGAADSALGGYRELLHARAAHPGYSGAGQYGGVTSALAAVLLKEKDCDAALLTGTDGLYPRWTLAREEAEVLAAAGSKYGVCPGLAGLNQALGKTRDRLAVVGRPCQVVALRKMQHVSSVESRDKVGLILGLFCFWGLDYSFYRSLVKRGVRRVFRADIPKDEGLTLETDRGTVTFSLEETRSFIRRGCHSCIDPTAELADLSIGSTESDPGWCTLIVRTSAGTALVEKAVASGLLEIKDCLEEAAASLRTAALNKKRRVLSSAPEEGGPAVDSSYLRLAEETRCRIMGEGA